ncbi:MAG: histidine phosphatase family protein [Roseiflexaceae bacterium]|nr:histidine phosphatase family protein [Roseiflexaceae bacterium]
MRTSIWLVRHGQTELNKARRYQGANDSPLTKYGQMQVQALAHRLRRIPFSVAIISPSGRARATAAAILSERTAPVVEDQRWAETHQGRWEGLTYAEVRARFPNEVATRFGDALNGRAQGGESLAEVHARVGAGWNAILREHPNGRILVVTHATPIQLVMCATANLPPTLHWRWRVDLASLTVLDVYGAGPIIRTVNEVTRLVPGEE